MTLKDLRTYYRLREYQISHLLNAQEFHKHGKNFEQQMYSFLFYWADAMYEADQIQNTKGFVTAQVFQSRGEL